MINVYSGYGIGFDAGGSSSLFNGSGFGKNVILVITYMSSSIHINNKKKDILILGKGPIQGLDNTTSTTEKEYAINFRRQQKKFCLILYYDGANSYSFDNDVKIYKFKAKFSEINAVLSCLGNVSKDFNDKKVRYKMDSYIFHTVLLVIIPLFIITIVCYHYAKHKAKLKKHIAVLKI